MALRSLDADGSPVQAGRHLAVAGHGNEVHAVEGPRVADGDDQVTGGVDAGVAVTPSRRRTSSGGTVRPGMVRLRRHAGAGHHEYPGVDGHVALVRRGPPGQQVVEGEADLHAEEVGRLLPRRQGPQPGGRAEAHAALPRSPRPVGVARPSASMVRTLSSLVRAPASGSSP